MEGLGLDDLRVIVSSYPLATIVIIVDHLLFFVAFVFIRLLQAVPFPFLGYGVHSSVLPLPELPRIDSIAVIRGVLVWPFPYL